MAEKLSAQDVQWLRKLARGDMRADNRIPPITLGRLLKYGMVETYDMLSLRITRKGRKRVAATSPGAGERDGLQSVRYGLCAGKMEDPHPQV